MARRLLAIESATDWLSVALLEGAEVVRLERASGTRQHAAALLPHVQSILAEAGWSLAQIDALGVSAGPGSFTSLRIGLATAKGLGFGRDWAAVGVSTLAAMALGAFDGESDAPADAASLVVPLLDARRGEWYGGGFRRQGAGVEAVVREALYDPASLAADLAGEGEAVLVCPERGGWGEGFTAAGVDVSRAIEGEAARPRADRVGQLAQRVLEAGEGDSIEALAARYLRRAEAEAKRLGEAVETGERARVQGDEG